jgi:hypothetical protein
MRTTININDALLKEIRRQAGASGRPFRKVFEEIILRGLGSSKKSKTKRRVRIHARPLGLKPVYHNISLNQLYDQFEAEETAAKRRP